MSANRTFPPYAYVSGLHPHPTRDSAGHSYRQPSVARVALDPAEWRENTEYIHGFELFNRGYYWEAHEAWEALWHAAGRRGVIADFLKALIGLAAAGYKAREGRANGVRRHAERARALFQSVQDALRSDSPWCGLDLGNLIREAEELGASAESVVDTSAKAVVPVLSFRISFVG